jgi:imidazolonepropionase-like amidohydrolase
MIYMSEKDALYALCPGRIYSAAGGYFPEGYAVLVENGLILSVAPSDSLPCGVKKINLGDMTLMPGLIDTHIHLDDWMMPILLACGITTVRDTGNDIDWILEKKEAAKDPGTECPSIICCGPMLDRSPCYHKYISWEVKNTAGMKDSIRSLCNRKVDAVKLYEGLDIERVRAGIGEAGRCGLHVLGHFEERVKLAEAVGAGVGETEHLTGIPKYFSAEIVELICEKKAWTVPTQIVFEQAFDFTDNDKYADKMEYIPESVLDYWKAYLKITGKAYGGYTDLKSYCENHRAYLSELIKNKARLAVGTDAPYQCSMPGFSYVNELRIFSACGMGNAEVIESATARGAELLGIKNAAGTIEAGKRADMIAVRGDPVKDLGCLEHIEAVIKKGRIYDPSKLLRDAPKKHPGTRFDGMYRRYEDIYRSM